MIIKETKLYGLKKISTHIPTAMAQRYLHYYLEAGWHSCNTLYHRKYDQGVDCVFILFTVQGTGVINCGKYSFHLSENSIVIIPPGIPLEYYTDKQSNSVPWEFFWLNLDGFAIRQFASLLWEDAFILHTCQSSNEYTTIFQALMSESVINHTQELMNHHQIQNLLELFAKDLFRANNTKCNSDMRIEPILTYLQSHYAQDVSLEKICQTFYISPNHLIKTFYHYTGYTPHEYIKMLRLQKACEYLQWTDLPIKEIVSKVGFTNNSHFATQFRAMYGMSPKEYRNQSGYSIEK